jgi:ABC-type polysaccharide/polyol phosphate export permease
MFVMGLGLFFCAINTFFEDIKFMLASGLWLLFFLTPVMWFVETFYYSNPRHYKLLTILNPISIPINGYRKMMLPLQAVVVQPKSDPLHRTSVPPIGISWVHISYFGVVSVLTLVIGYAVFNRLKWRFAERP